MAIDDRTWAVMNDRIAWLKNLAKRREYKFGVKGETFLSILYCSMRNIMDAEYARIAVGNINDKLDEPLTDVQLKELVYKPIDEADTIRKFKNETIIQKLDITLEEEVDLEIGINMKKRLEGKERSKARKERNQIIIQEFHNGSSAKQLSEKYSLSERQIKTILKPYKRYVKRRRDENIIDAHFNWGFSISELAKAWGCSRKYIHGLIKEYKLSEESVTKMKTLPELEIQSSDKEITKVDKVKFVINGMEEIFSLYMESLVHSSIDEQAIALSKLKNNSNNFFIQGDGGTGKTYLLKQYLQSLTTEERKATLLIAPTGVSASHINGTTIHKTFALECDVIPNIKITDVPKVLDGINQIIIDEINMVRIDVFDYLCRIVQYVKEEEHRSIRLIVMGDFGQIQPVATKTDIAKIAEQYPMSEGLYAFDSEFWDTMQFKKILLTYVHRQDNQELIKHLREIKYGKISALDWFNENCDMLADENAVYICPTRELVDYYNNQAILKFAMNDFTEFHAIYTGDITNVDVPASKILKLCVGMRIMTIYNSAQFQNGSMGTITKINSKSIRIKIDDGEEVLIRPKVFTLSNNVKYKQYGIRMAYAVTANKCEGCTFSSVNIVSGFFAPNQLYVALSRCKTLDKIHILGRLKESDLHVDKRALELTILR